MTTEGSSPRWSNGDDKLARADTFLGLTKVQFIGVVVTAVVVMSAMLSLVIVYNSSVNRHNISRNTKAIHLLCDRGRIIDGLVMASVNVFESRIQDERGHPEVQATYRRAIIEFTRYHAELVKEQAIGPCVGR